MRLERLELGDWRNAARTAFDSDAGVVVLHGENGQGKTNLLEAVWMLGALRSFREARVGRLVRHGREEARIAAVVVGRSGRRRLEWRWRGGARTLLVDGVPTRDLGAWFAILRAVLFCPEQVGIVRGGPAERRAFLDRAAFAADPGHLEVARAYRRAVRQRAALLAAPPVDPDQLAAWDADLVARGAELVRRRALAVAALREPFREAHRALAGAGEVDLRLRGWAELDAASPAAIPAIRERLARLLEERRPEELRQGRVLVGPHRDELDILLDGRPARVHASQGQARTLVLALKLAELEAARRAGETPLFLLDDLGGELDRRRMERLTRRLVALPNQVWLTTTDPGLLGGALRRKAKLLEVAGGRARRQGRRGGTAASRRPGGPPPARRA